MKFTLHIAVIALLLLLAGCSGRDGIPLEPQPDISEIEDEQKPSPQYYEGYAEGAREALRNNPFLSQGWSMPIYDSFSPESHDYARGLNDGYNEVLEVIIEIGIKRHSP